MSPHFFMKYKIPLILLAAIRTLAEGVNAAFTVMLTCYNCYNRYAKILRLAARKCVYAQSCIVWQLQYYSMHC